MYATVEIAMTNGEAVAPLPLRRSGLLYGTIKPTNQQEGDNIEERDTKSCLVARGRACRGFLVSAAARPTSSVPEKARRTVTKTEQKPLKPSEGIQLVHDLPRTRRRTSKSTGIIPSMCPIIMMSGTATNVNLSSIMSLQLSLQK